MSIVLIRHGETALNVARVLQPPATPLSARGIAQAEAMAQRLADFGITAIVSSDLPRALRTAQVLAAATGAAIEVTELLRERDFGDWRGLPYDTLPDNPLTMAGAPPGGESARAFAQRVALAFAHVAQRRACVVGSVAVVSHGLVLREMLDTLADVPAGLPVPAQLGNTCISVLGAEPPHTATLVACTRHLDAAAAGDTKALSGG